MSYFQYKPNKLEYWGKYFESQILFVIDTNQTFSKAVAQGAKEKDFQIWLFGHESMRGTTSRRCSGEIYTEDSENFLKPKLEYLSHASLLH